MNKNTDFKKATKKVVSLAVLYVGLMLLVLWLLVPLDGLYEISIYSSVVLFLGYCALRDIKRNIYKMICQNCKTDIYPFICAGESIRSPIKHCPVCGDIVEKI